MLTKIIINNAVVEMSAGIDHHGHIIMRSKNTIDKMTELQKEAFKSISKLKPFEDISYITVEKSPKRLVHKYDI